MQLDPTSRRRALHELGDSYLHVALSNIVREFPVFPWYVATRPGTYPTHREAHPVFYGSFDWHSCVEMHWVIVRILRLQPDTPLAAQATAQLHSLITPKGMATERAFFLDPDLGNFERPYGWGWYLTLAAEAHRSQSTAASHWAALLRPLADTIEQQFIDWLPKLTYPQRTGLHPNTAFALFLARPWARIRAEDGDSSLLDAIELAAFRYFLRDADYPARYEPSGADFLSPALTEAVLMRHVLDPQEYIPWLDSFLPGLPDGPKEILYPADVSDPTDGQIAHLHGLNLSRAWAWLEIASALPNDDPRQAPILESASRHAAASLPFVTGSDYAVEHWLAVYATLLLTFDLAEGTTDE
ncbi:MAG: DUF2891 domain-containing protein [Thermomicrobiales bacterium]|nr:DUF2891 domain-containing protein [Thermomicrobiales bacterium]